MTDVGDGPQSRVTITVRRLAWADLAPHLPPRTLALLAPPVEVAVERRINAVAVPVRHDHRPEPDGGQPVAAPVPGWTGPAVLPVTKVPVADVRPQPPGHRREQTRVRRLRRLVTGRQRRS